MQNPYFFFDNPLLVNELIKQGIDIEKLKEVIPDTKQLVHDELIQMLNDGTLADITNSVINPNDIVLIGDSYTVHNKYQQYLTPFFDNIYTFAKGGSGLARYVDGISFKELVTQAVATLTDTQKAGVKYVVIYGGVNDIANQTDIGVCSANLESMLTTLTGAFENATIHLFPMNLNKTWSWAKSDFYTYNNVWYNATYNNPRAIVHNGAFGWLKTDTDLYDDDTLHPSDPKGYKVIAQNIVNCLLGNGATNYKQFVIDCSVVTGLTGKLYFYIYDGILYIDRNLITTNFDETPAGNVITITDDFPVYFGFTNYIPVVSGRELAGWLDIHENTLKLHIGGDYITTNIYTVPTSEIIGF